MISTPCLTNFFGRFLGGTLSHSPRKSLGDSVLPPWAAFNSLHDLPTLHSWHDLPRSTISTCAVFHGLLSHSLRRDHRTWQGNFRGISWNDLLCGGISKFIFLGCGQWGDFHLRSFPIDGRSLRKDRPQRPGNGCMKPRFDAMAHSTEPSLTVPVFCEFDVWFGLSLEGVWPALQ